MGCLVVEETIERDSRGKHTRLSDSGCGGAVQTLAVANQLFLILSHFEVCKRDEG